MKKQTLKLLSAIGQIYKGDYTRGHINEVLNCRLLNDKAIIQATDGFSLVHFESSAPDLVEFLNELRPQFNNSESINLKIEKFSCKKFEEENHVLNSELLSFNKIKINSREFPRTDNLWPMQDNTLEKIGLGAVNIDTLNKITKLFKVNSWAFELSTPLMPITAKAVDNENALKMLIMPYKIKE